MNVIIEIEELVLHGFPAGERYAIAEGLAGELSQLVAERPALLEALQAADGVSMGKVLTGQFVLSRGAQGEAIGMAAGQAVLQAIEAVLASDRR